MTSTLIPPLIGAIGLLVAVIIYGIVRRYDAGSAALVKIADAIHEGAMVFICLLYTSPSPRDGLLSRMPSSA